MRDREKLDTGLLHSCEHLREILLERPELPLLVFAGEEANGGDFPFVCCGNIRAEIGEFLDCRQEVYEELASTSREEFQDAIETYSDFEGTDEEFDKYIKARMAEYEPYWKPCIILYVDN